MVLIYHHPDDTFCHWEVEDSQEEEAVTLKEMLWRSDRVEKRNSQADQGRDDGRQHTGVLEREREGERENYNRNRTKLLGILVGTKFGS